MSRARFGLGDSRDLASRLRERITIQMPQDSADDQGGTIRDWTPLCTCFAEVTPLYSEAAERLVAGQLVMRGLYRVVIRKRSDVRADMRVLWKSKYFNIRAVIENESSVEIIMEEGVAI